MARTLDTSLYYYDVCKDYHSVGLNCIFNYKKQILLFRSFIVSAKPYLGGPIVPRPSFFGLHFIFSLISQYPSFARFRQGINH